MKRRKGKKTYKTNRAHAKPGILRRVEIPARITPGLAEGDVETIEQDLKIQEGKADIFKRPG